jgi:HTH-type transcriptional regulator/antitoxin HipB
MKTVNGLKAYSFDEIKDKYLGKIGTRKRDTFEFELQMELLGHMIKEARLKRGLNQAQLGKLVGVQKAQISRLEKSAKNVTFATITKVFEALDAKISLRVELSKKKPTAKTHKKAA